MNTRSIILLATNKSAYLEFAINCAESILLHNPDLPVYIVTNLTRAISSTKITLLQIDDKLAWLFIEAKLYLNDFLQTEETLFIDSDCLCYGNLKPIFDACAGMDMSVIGTPITLENYWGMGEKGAAFARREFGIDRSLLFNGGFYYLKNTLTTQKIFLKARELSSRYDEYNFTRIQNGWKNEEELLSIAMVANSQQPIKDDGTFMADLAIDQRPKLLNVITGKRQLNNPPPPSKRHRNWFPETISPIIIHFGGSNIRSYPYISQRWLLTLFNAGLPKSLSSVIVYLIIDIPYRSYHWLRGLLTRANV